MRTRNARRATRDQRAKFTRLPGSRRPFKHLAQLEASMKAVVDKGLQPLERQQELNALPPYVSRGHGGRHRTTNRLIGGKWYYDRSKYAPGEEDMKHNPTPANKTLRERLGLA